MSYVHFSVFFLLIYKLYFKLSLKITDSVGATLASLVEFLQRELPRSSRFRNASSWSSPSNLSPDLKRLFWLPWACVLSHIWLFVTPWMVAHQDSSVHGAFQARTLEWIGISYAPRSSWTRDQTHVSSASCIWRQIFFLTLCHLGSTLATLTTQTWKGGDNSSRVNKAYWGRCAGGGSLRLFFLLVRYNICH